MTLEVKNLQCTRGERELFTNLSFSLEKKQLLMLEGRNGSGKTTLLRALCGMYLPDSGEILWNGVSIKKQDENYRQELLYLGHLNAIKADMTVLENLRFNCLLAGQPVVDSQLMNALDTIGLYAFEDYPTSQLSQGQKRRVALARLLVSKASLWILDEPFVALDVAAVELLQSIIAGHIEKGCMLVLTTHQEVTLKTGEIKRLSLNEVKFVADQQEADSEYV